MKFLLTCLKIIFLLESPFRGKKRISLTSRNSPFTLKSHFRACTSEKTRMYQVSRLPETIYSVILLHWFRYFYFNSNFFFILFLWKILRTKRKHLFMFLKIHNYFQNLIINERII